MITLKTSADISFSVRPIGNYKDVEVTAGNTTIALGLVDYEQALATAKVLKQAIYELLDHEAYEALMADEI